MADIGKMNAAQVMAYANEKGIDLSGCKTKADKIKAIREAEGADKVTVTVMGITVTIDENAIDDFDIVEDLCKLQDGDIFVLPRLVKNLFGDDFADIRKKLSDKNGKLTATKAAEFFAAVLEAKAKN